LSNYQVPAAPLCFEQVINKSRFITHIARVENKDQAKAFIDSIKAQYPDARHHCWAYIAGHPTATTDIGFSDDGEPSGTAGKPMLNVLQHKGVGEIVLVVVRYFGGIKLGAGGLVRAYSSSASLAMDKLEVMTLVDTTTFTLTFDYSLENQVKHLFKREHINVLKADYHNHICYTFEIPTSAIESFNAKLVQTSLGKLDLTYPRSSIGT
jgi:uncharacterized YigZ family protein